MQAERDTLTETVRVSSEQVKSLKEVCETQKASAESEAQQMQKDVEELQAQVTCHGQSSPPESWLLTRASTQNRPGFQTSSVLHHDLIDSDFRTNP